MGIRTVAVYSTVDKDSLPVRFADEAVCIGPPASTHSYLSIPSIMAAAELTNADAIHPGYGFLAESALLAQVCAEHHIKFIGPHPEAISTMGDKAVAVECMRQAGVPTVPGSNGAVACESAGLETAKSIGFPVLIKAAAGGGGKGIKAVYEASAFAKSWQAAQQEAKAAFCNSTLYIEKLIEKPRHVEIQIMRDQQGTCVHLSERDCSVQRRHQKLIEETPCVALNDDLRQEMGRAAIQAAERVNYEGLGTVEFLLDSQGNFYFMEMNTRLQVEHPVTEMVTGLDLVQSQVQIACGMPIEPNNRMPAGHAIECRINAEDVSQNFRPHPGQVKELHLPGGGGVRVDTHLYAGCTIPPHYDSMIAKLIVWAPDRKQAVDRMRRALEEFVVVGVPTTIPLHRLIMHQEEFRRGMFTTDFINTIDLTGLDGTHSIY